jgi:hypothetical protein
MVSFAEGIFSVIYPATFENSTTNMKKTRKILLLVVIHKELYNKKHIPEKHDQLLWYINKIKLLCQFVWSINFLTENNETGMM